MNRAIHPYSTLEYANSLAKFGIIHRLSESAGLLIFREIPDSDLKDAMGPYPLFSCKHWDALPNDLDRLKNEVVSVVLILDPFGLYPREHFTNYFDEFRIFKKHYVLEFKADWERDISKTHKKNARHGLRYSSVILADNPVSYVNEWHSLYSNLITKHNLRGLHTFSLESFRDQLSVPGCLLFLVIQNENVIGANIFYVHEDVAYGHLSAFSDEGYKIDAAYSVIWFALNYLHDKVRYVDFGGVPGLRDGEANGLQHFKQGWSNTTRDALLAGKILQKYVYNVLAKNLIPKNNYFPAYRYTS